MSLRSIYRYGGMQQCQRKQDDWKFCMNMKFANLTEDEMRAKWIDRRAKWWAMRRTGYGDANSAEESAFAGGSSEDIWGIRECVYLFSLPVSRY